ncbi:recombinase family protein, partial [Treponema berlinense]
MTYGYIRVSTSHQNLENQQMEIEKFCQLNGLK